MCISSVDTCLEGSGIFGSAQAMCIATMMMRSCRMLNTLDMGGRRVECEGRGWLDMRGLVGSRVDVGEGLDGDGDERKE